MVRSYTQPSFLLLLLITCFSVADRVTHGDLVSFICFPLFGHLLISLGRFWRTGMFWIAGKEFGYAKRVERGTIGLIFFLFFFLPFS